MIREGLQPPESALKLGEIATLEPKLSLLPLDTKCC
jgi:hypothetical protein